MHYLLRMRPLLLAVGLWVSGTLCKAQALYIDNGVVTSDKEVAAAIDFYRQYLGEVRFDAAPDFKKYWRAKDVAQYKKPDQLYDALGTGYPTYLMCESRTLIYARPQKDYVHLKTLLAGTDSLKNISVTAITNHYVGFGTDGKPYFINPLDVHAADWKVAKRRNVTFIHPAYHRFEAARADSLVASIQKLEKDWGLEPIAIRYYFADTFDELHKIRGFDFVMSMGNREVPRGKTDMDDNLIYASGLGENYLHEVVHIYLNRRFPRSPLLEGVATFYGGGLQNNLAWHIKRLDDYVQKHPELDLNKFRDFLYLDHYTNPNNTIEGLLCWLAYKKDGLVGLKRIMSYTSLEEVFQKEFNVAPGGWNAFLRKALQQERRTAHHAFANEPHNSVDT